MIADLEIQTLSNELGAALSAPLSAFQKVTFWDRVHGTKVVSSDAEAEVRELARSIRYRFDSVLFHISLLHALDEDHHAELDSAIDDRESRGVLRRAATQQTFLFDDIVILAITALDYSANLVGVALAGYSRRQLKWGGLLTQAALSACDTPDVGLQRLRRSGVGRLATTENDLWIKMLAKYRGDVAHYSASEPNGAVQRRYVYNAPSVDSIHVYAPGSAVVALGTLVAAFDRVSVADAAEAIVRRLFDSLTRLSIALWADLRHEYEASPAPLTHLWLPTAC